MSSLRALTAAALMAALASSTFAQTAAPAAPGSAAAPGPGGPGMGPGMGRGPGAGPGMGYGAASAPGRGWRASPNNTPGWALMTPEERAAHQQRMNGMTSRADCMAYQQQHHQEMAARAQQRGASAPAQPRRDWCAGLK
ncbi:MAG TPA: hypothetical protein VLE94_02350 [Burkholderiaceae bacterium]|nr:hypothetical protein [Burkholderiaceae bacterium]